MTDPIALLVISEYPVVRLGLLAYLDSSSVTVTGQVDSLDKASEHLRADNTDVVLVDLALLKPSGLSPIRQLLKDDPGIKIIVISRDEKEPFVTQSMENGALGYVSLRCSRDELIEAVRTVYRNERYLSRDVAYGYAIASLNKTDHALSSLTTREYQVFALLAKGTAVADVAAALFISPKTVHVYRTNIFHKLKLSSSYELTLLALRHGVISLEGIE